MIDRNLFAVKVWQDVGDYHAYVIIGIFRSFCGASRYRQGQGKRHLGMPPKIVHPADWVVKAFLSFGNTIHD
jgi:hypothetical protein